MATMSQPSESQLVGVAGSKGASEPDANQQTYDQLLKSDWGPTLASSTQSETHVLATTSAVTQSQAGTSWNDGVSKERRLPATVRRELGDSVIVLDDRVNPRSGGRIEHLIVAPSGLWIVDTSSCGSTNVYSSVHSRRAKADAFTDGRNRGKLVAAMQAECDSVGAVLQMIGSPGIPVHGAVCFADTDRPRFGGSSEVNGVWIGYTRTLIKRVKQERFYTADQVLNLAHQLAHQIPQRT